MNEWNGMGWDGMGWDGMGWMDGWMDGWNGIVEFNVPLDTV